MGTRTGYLTTHILDTANGCPAANVRIDVYRLQDTDRHLVTSVETNHDGRTDEPVVKAGALQAGVYELVFHIGDYFSDLKPEPNERFIDVVPIRFRVSDDNAHYHVPLLASPYSYSTYRGS